MQGAGSTEGFIRGGGGGPAELGEEGDGGLGDEVVFGVGVGGHVCIYR